MHMKKFFAVALTAAAIGLAGCATSSTDSAAPAAATEPAEAALSVEDAIFERQNAMREIGAAARSLQSGGDLAALQATGRTIADAAQRFGELFPEGSGPGEGVETGASAAIWTNRAAFDQQVAALVAAAQATANAPNAQAAGAAAGGIGATCRTCHSQFRTM